MDRKLSGAYGRTPSPGIDTTVKIAFATTAKATQQISDLRADKHGAQRIRSAAAATCQPSAELEFLESCGRSLGPIRASAVPHHQGYDLTLRTTRVRVNSERRNTRRPLFLPRRLTGRRAVVTAVMLPLPFERRSDHLSCR